MQLCSSHGKSKFVKEVIANPRTTQCQARYFDQQHSFTDRTLASDCCPPVTTGEKNMMLRLCRCTLFKKLISLAD